MVGPFTDLPRRRHDLRSEAQSPTTIQTGTGTHMDQQKHTGELCIMNRTGDTRILWNKDSGEGVDVALAAFQRLEGQGYAGFSVPKKGGVGNRIKEFDRQAEQIIMVPQIVGG